MNEFANRASLLVDLGEAMSFANEKQLALSRTFGFTINNSGGSAQKVLLNDSDLTTTADKQRLVTDGLIVYTGGANDLRADSINDVKIADILKRVKSTPIRALWMKVDTNNIAQLSQQLKIVPKSIFNTPETQSIDLGAYKDPKNPNDKLVNVPLPNTFQFDPETEIYLSVPGNTITTFTFYCGGIFSPSEILYKSAIQAGVKG